MLRHPIYLLICAAACSYLTWSNARGWSPFHFAAPRSAAGGVGSNRGAMFFHK